MKVKYVIPVVILLISALIFLGYLLGSRKTDRALQTTIDAQNKEIQRYITRIGDDSVFIAQKDTEILSQREAIKRGDIERKELRALNLKQVSEITRLKLKIDTLIHTPSDTEVVFVDTCSGTPKPAILLPYSWSFPKNKYLSLKDSIDIRGDHFTRLGMDIPLDVWVGKDKDTKAIMAKVTTPNEFIKVISINSFKFDVPKPKPYGIGAFVGYGVGKNGLTPVVALGIGYTPIRF